MNPFLRGILALLATLFLAPTAAWATVSCTITAAPSLLKAVYSAASNLDGQGTFNVNCSKASGDARRQDIWIGIDQPSTGRNLTNEVTSSNQISYFLYRKTWGSGVWGNTGSYSATQTAYGGLADRIDFGSSQTVSVSYTFYVRAPAGQNKPAGVYVDTFTATLKLTDENGTFLGSTMVSGNASIPNDCHFEQATVSVIANYTAFQASLPLTTTVNLTCTLGTTYTLELDAARGMVPNVQLVYSAALTGATTGSGQAVAQPYTVTITFDAGQAGRCTSGPTCQATDTRTVTVRY